VDESIRRFYHNQLNGDEIKRPDLYEGIRSKAATVPSEAPGFVVLKTFI
jgi:hypothetical protein